MNVTGYNLKNFYTGIMKAHDPLYKYQFIVEFIGLQDRWGISDSSDASKNISYYAQSANIPGVQLTTGTTAFLGTQFRAPGVAQYGHNWTLQIFLTQDLGIYKGFRRWQEEISTLYKDGGGMKAIPDVQLRAAILNSDGTFKEQGIVLEGVWPAEVPQMQMQYADGGGSELKMGINLRYQYNYMDDASKFDLSTDPLKA